MLDTDLVVAFETPLGACFLRPRCSKCRGRGCSACGHTACKISPRCFKKRLWTPEEDARMLRIAQEAETVHFPTIAKKFDGRSTQAVRERYRNYTSRKVKKRVTYERRKWTPREIQILREHSSEKLRTLAKRFSNRSMRSIQDKRLCLRRQSQGTS